jgi:hypothetical protein
MKKTTFLVAFVVTVMMMFTSSTAQAAEKKVGMLPFVTDEFPQLTKQQYLDFLINSKIENNWKFYATGFKSHTAEYAALAKQQVKARIQILTGSSDKMSDQELIDFVNNKCEIVPVGTKEVVNSTATKIDSVTGKVLGHATAKQRIGARMNKITKAIEQKLVVKATGDVVSYLSCVNTGTDDPTEVVTDTDDGSDEGDSDDESTEETTVKKTVTASNGKIDINVNIKNVNKNINTNTNKNENTATVEKVKKSAWDDDGVDYGNKYAEEEVTYVKPKKKILVERDDVEYVSTSRNKGCNNCVTDPKLIALLEQQIKVGRRGNWLAGINAVANVFSAVIGGMSYFKSNDGNWYVGNGNGGDGDFVDAGSSNQQIGVSGADGTFVYP